MKLNIRGSKLPEEFFMKAHGKLHPQSHAKS